jgi:hypothetical protein
MVLTRQLQVCGGGGGVPKTIPGLIILLKESEKSLKAVIITVLFITGKDKN